jgi:hypothetical protein
VLAGLAVLDEDAAVEAAPPAFFGREPVDEFSVVVVGGGGGVVVVVVGVAPRAEAGACVRGFPAADAQAVAVRAAGGLFGLVDAADPFAAVWGRAVQAVGGGQGELGLFVLVALEEVARGVFGDGAVGDRVEAAFGGPLDWVGDGGRDEGAEAGPAVEVAGGFDEVFAGEVVEAGDACAERGLLVGERWWW